MRVEKKISQAERRDLTTNDATLAERNEQYKDKPVSEATYEIDGQLFTVTSHYVGEKSLGKELYRMAFERAYAETVEQV